MIPAYNNANPTPHQDAIREAMLRMCRAEGHKPGVINKRGQRLIRDRRADILKAAGGGATMNHIRLETGIPEGTLRGNLQKLVDDGELVREYRAGRNTRFWVYRPA